MLLSLHFINYFYVFNLLSFCEDPPLHMLNETFWSWWCKKEIKENNAWFIYAIGVNSAEEMFMCTKAWSFIKRETLAQVFPYEFCKISNNTFLTENF